jgi:hypothetical protein
MSIDAALRAARQLADGEIEPPALPPGPRQRRFAIGDPQAPIEVFLEILDRHDLLDDSGWLVAGASLISIGDHFDFGAFEERERVARSGLELLGWLAAHPADQVEIIAGNHDLGRVGELVGFDDESFAVVAARAREAYRDGDPDPTLEAALLDRWPALPTAELAARDFAAFTVAQHNLVKRLLRAGRMRIAAPVAVDVLACHAGVTTAELDALGFDASAADATAVAAAINTAFDQAVAEWAGRGPLSSPILHTPGDAESGEGGGMLYHRPANPEVTGEPETYAGPNRRRYDPRTLPIGLTQIVGHISDAKCRDLLGDWVEGETAPGQIRHLETDGEQVVYRPGRPETLTGAGDRARLVFIDGGMNKVPPSAREILEI